MTSSIDAVRQRIVTRSVGRRIRLAIATALATVVFAFTAAAANAQEARPAQDPGRGVDIQQKLGVQVPLDAEFRNAQGETVALGSLLDERPVILNLVYFECPMLCNMALDGLVRSLRALEFEPGEEFSVITVSFDPRETPELAAKAKRTMLSRYGRPGAQESWHFLTGEKPEIDRLAESVGFDYRYDAKTGQYAHAAGLIVLTPEGRASRYLLGVEYALRDLRLSLVEAAENEIGSLSDQVLLLCYQYDPTTGRYGLLIQDVLRLAGMATVVLLGGSIATMLFVERRKRAAQREAETSQ